MESSTASRRQALLIAAFFVLVAILAIAPVRSYDFFWHLATGRWIVEHKALPASDPFSLSSDHIEWIDGEWLFQIAAWLVQAAGGTAAICVARGLVVAAMFAIAFAIAARQCDPAIAALACAIGWLGADHRLTARPESVATVLLVIALWLIFREPTTRTMIAFAVVCAVWINIHPSALLAPAIAGLVAVTNAALRVDARATTARRLVLAAAGGISLLANPWGIEGILAPMRLASLASAGGFVNMEWTSSRFADFPLLYAVVAGYAIVVLVGQRRRERVAGILVFAFLAALAFRYVRNQGFFFAAMPILASPLLPKQLLMRVRFFAASLALAVAILVPLRQGGVGIGVDQSQFPVASVAYFESLGLEGNVYNPDQLGGYLIWSFYPERRVLTDGRNELHRTFIESFAKARLDGRAWRAMEEKHRLVLAVDEYHRESMDLVDPRTGERKKLPASLIYFPRTRWALIAFDDVAMVFARRDSFDPKLLEKLEYKSLVPDGAVPFVDTSRATIDLARGEVARARRDFGDQMVVNRIGAMLDGAR